MRRNGEAPAAQMRRNLVAIAEFGEHEKQREQHADGQEGGKRAGRPHQHVFGDDADAARAQSQDLLGIGDDVEGQHEYGDAEQNDEEAHGNHAREHPGDDLHWRKSRKNAAAPFAHRDR